MKIKFLAIFSVAVIALASCSSSDYDENNGNGNGTDVEMSDVEVKFGSSLEINVKPQSSPLTRAHDGTWDDNDRIGIYMIKSETLNPWDLPPIYSNIEYKNKLTSHTPQIYEEFIPVGTTMYYPTTGNVNFVAYYPYSSTAVSSSHVYSVDVKSQSSQEAIDLLYAARTADYDKTSGTVQLDFKHKLSKLIINIIPGEGVSENDAKTASIIFEEYLTENTLDITTGNLGTAQAKDNITPIATTTTTLPTNVAAQYEAIVIPQKVESDLLWKITVNGETFTWNPIKETTIPKYESGSRYIYNITVKKHEIKVEGKIEDWTPGGTGSGTAD